MIGGGIPGQTQVISVKLYQLVESLQFGEAHRLAAGLLAFSFIVLLTMFLTERRSRKTVP
jgi:molybdate transport system permease protein